MSVKIRLRRMGTRGKPFYRMVVADSRSPRDGRFIETLGYYNPRTEPPTIKIDEEKALLWLSRGAQPSDTAAALLKQQNVMAKFAESKGAAAETAPVVEEPVVAAEEPAPTRKRRTKAAAETEEAPVVEAEAEAPAVEAEASVEPEASEAEQSTEEQG